MKDLVSVIIPVYNVEKYIDECFKSLKEQVYKNIEVIIVDDGSTDNSGRICDRYVESDNRFFVYHTENKGIGAARNFALEKAKGEFCFFLDPDDVLESDSLSYLIDLIKKTQSDIALAVTRQFKGNYTIVGEEDIVEAVYDNHKDICEKVTFDKNDLKPLSRKTESSTVTYEFFSSLYRTDFLNKNGIRFLPISYGEDTYVCFKYLLLAQRVVTSTKTVYSHRRNPTSTTFQYHPYYLAETKKYYEYYLGLFEDISPEYFDRAREALDAQYLRRCSSAIERELFMSPINRTLTQKLKTLKNISNDKKFRQLFTLSNIKYLQSGIMRIVFYSIKFRIYIPIVFIINLFRNVKSR